MGPKVSIIIPTHNRSQLLQERALKSVFNQTEKNFECIVVDDASTDNTSEVVKNWWVRYIKLPFNKGSANAKAEGLRIAKGDYIVFLDDDNELLPEFLQKTLERARMTQADAIQVGRYIHHRDGVSVYTDYAAPHTGVFPCSMDWGWLIKRHVFDAITWDNKCGPDEDMDFGIQFFAKFQADQVFEALTIAYGYSSDPLDSQSYPTEERLRCLNYFIQKHHKLYDKYPNEQRYLFRLAARNYYQAGHPLMGIMYFWKSWRAQPTWQSFDHFLYSLAGWNTYNSFMIAQEKQGARERMHG